MTSPAEPLVECQTCGATVHHMTEWRHQVWHSDLEELLNRLWEAS